jgi:hypothetical protein
MLTLLEFRAGSVLEFTEERDHHVSCASNASSILS